MFSFESVNITLYTFPADKDAKIMLVTQLKADGHDMDVCIVEKTLFDFNKLESLTPASRKMLAMIAIHIVKQYNASLDNVGTVITQEVMSSREKESAFHIFTAMMKIAVKEKLNI